jgi:hypothetical protein
METQMNPPLRRIAAPILPPKGKQGTVHVCADQAATPKPNKNNVLAAKTPLQAATPKHWPGELSKNWTDADEARLRARRAEIDAMQHKPEGYWP